MSIRIFISVSFFYSQVAVKYLTNKFEWQSSETEVQFIFYACELFWIDTFSDHQKPTWKQFVNNVLRNIKLFTRLTNSLIFQLVMYTMSHSIVYIGVLMHAVGSWPIFLIHWILYIAVIIINVIGISPRDLFYLGLFLVITLEIKKVTCVLPFKKLAQMENSVLLKLALKPNNYLRNSSLLALLFVLDFCKIL